MEPGEGKEEAIIARFIAKLPFLSEFDREVFDSFPFQAVYADEGEFVPGLISVSSESILKPYLSLLAEELR